MPGFKLPLEEIIKMIEKIEESAVNFTFESFSRDFNLLDATLMRLHFIGENAKTIPYELKKEYKQIRWKKFARLRNIIGHKYSIINKEVVWDVIKVALPEFKKQIKEILEQE